jgi:hypothetical protein
MPKRSVSPSRIVFSGGFHVAAAAPLRRSLCFLFLFCFPRTPCRRKTPRPRLVPQAPRHRSAAPLHGTAPRHRSTELSTAADRELQAISLFRVPGVSPFRPGLPTAADDGTFRVRVTSYTCATFSRSTGGIPVPGPGGPAESSGGWRRDTGPRPGTSRGNPSNRRPADRSYDLARLGFDLPRPHSSRYVERFATASLLTSFELRSGSPRHLDP